MSHLQEHRHHHLRIRTLESVVVEGIYAAEVTNEGKIKFTHMLNQVEPETEYQPQLHVILETQCLTCGITFKQD